MAGTNELEQPRGIFCNRTLNLNAIRAIGYDMDYTLIHYRMEEWEKRAYAFIKHRLIADGWPIESLAFDPGLVMRGLAIDTENGNMVKANRFGYIKRAFHGTKPLDFEAQRQFYQRTLVDLNLPRWFFLNTLFSISEACLYLQLVDLLDRGKFKSSIGYLDLFKAVRRSVDEAHMEGRLKAEIIAAPGRFVDIDEETPLALLDQKKAGKKLLLISNSEWAYAAPMMSYVFDPFLPNGTRWSDLFDIIIVRARKPDFFSLRMPTYEVTTEDGLLREHRGLLKSGRVYHGGNAPLIEESLNLIGEEILYVGDHIFVDVNVSKSVLRWRTALVIRELEAEIEANRDFGHQHVELSMLMREKEDLELRYSQLRLDLLRIREDYGPRSGSPMEQIERSMSDLHDRIIEMDNRIAPIAQAAGRLLNQNWGPLMRTGIDKSNLARQVERYADIYTSRVSNFLHVTPYAFIRSRRGSLPHDSGEAPYCESPQTPALI